jgi:hypothetical protein
LNRLLESDMYDFFAYNKEVVSGTKYTVRVRVAREDLTLLRKVNQMLPKTFPWTGSPAGQRQSE